MKMNTGQRSYLNYKTLESPKAQEWIVFIHGAGGSLKSWKLQQSALAEHFNLLLVDLRDHGESKGLEPAFDQYHFSLITADILRVIDQHYCHQ